MFPRRVLGLIRQASDADGAVSVTLLNAEFARGGVHSTFGAPGIGFFLRLRNNPFLLDQLNPPGNLLIALQLRQFGAVQVLDGHAVLSTPLPSQVAPVLRKLQDVAWLTLYECLCARRKIASGLACPVAGAIGIGSGYVQFDQGLNVRFCSGSVKADPQLV